MKNIILISLFLSCFSFSKGFSVFEISIDKEIYGERGKEVQVGVIMKNSESVAGLELVIKSYPSGKIAFKKANVPIITEQFGNPMIMASSDSLKISGTALFRFLANPDSLVPDTLNSQSIVADIIDQNLIYKVQLRAISTLLNLGVNGKFSMAFTSDTAIVDSLIPTQPADSVRFSGKIPTRKLATQVRYQLLATDYLNRMTISEKKYIVAPRCGKKDLSNDPVNITDIVRATWLFWGLINNPSVIDYFGFDLDQSGDFDTPDLTHVLNIMKQDPCPNWTYAQSGTNILHIGKAQAMAGESDTVNVFITTDKPYSGADIILNFNPSKLKYDTLVVNSGAFFRGSGYWNVVHGNGSVRVACCSFDLSTIPLCDSVKFFSIVMNPAEGLPLGEVDTIHIRGILAETDNNYMDY